MKPTKTQMTHPNASILSEDDINNKHTSHNNNNNNSSTQYCFLYHWLDPKNPAGARRRIEDLYWSGWRAFVLGFILTSLGASFTGVGLGSIIKGIDPPRGWALLIVGGMLTLPGVYSLYILWQYICGRRGYSYLQLIDD